MLFLSLTQNVINYNTLCCSPLKTDINYIAFLSPNQQCHKLQCSFVPGSKMKWITMLSCPRLKSLFMCKTIKMECSWALSDTFVMNSGLVLWRKSTLRAQGSHSKICYWFWYWFLSAWGCIVTLCRRIHGNHEIRRTSRCYSLCLFGCAYA